MLYFIRILLCILLILLGGLFGLFWSLFRPFNPINTYWPSRFMGLVGLKILGIELQVEGREHLNLQRSHVIVSNHQHNLDLFPCCAIIPPRVVSMGKTDIKWIPLFGTFYWLSGNILINRKNRQQAFSTMDTAVKALTSKLIHVWIMPEGTRSRGRGILPFKKGAFHTAIKAKVPVLPVCLSSYHKNLRLNQWRAGKIIIQINPAISTEGMGPEQVQQLTDRCESLIRQGVEVLDQRLAAVLC